MIFSFKNKMTEENGICKIDVPFNVWEVSSEKGALSAVVTLEGHVFECKLEALGDGYYTFQVPAKLAASLEKKEFYNVTFYIKESAKKEPQESPYSLENPIRVVDNITLIKQPYDGLCGQSCIAMLAGISLHEAGEVMHCREWQASMEKIVETLDYLGIAHTNHITYNCGTECELPRCAVLLEKMGRYSHYLIYFEGKYYDTNEGVLDSIDKSKLIGYLEII